MRQKRINQEPEAHDLWTIEQDLLPNSVDDLSVAIGEPSLIALECQSGNFSDCDVSSLDERAPSACNGILIFAENNGTCGSFCGENLEDESHKKRKRRSENTGVGYEQHHNVRYY